MKGLAHAVDADNADLADTAIASPSPPAPARDPVEDADASFTRKRPRLDSGRNSLRALSHDTSEDFPETTAASPRDPDQQVEMTIRPHPSSSPVQAATPDGPSANGLVKDALEVSPIVMAATEEDLGSPPVMIIEDDDEASPPEYVVQVDARDYFRRFPLSRPGEYAQDILDSPQYVSGSTPIDGQVLPALTNWLTELPEPSVDIESFYTSKSAFWDGMAAFVNKLMNRRYAFGDDFQDDLQTERVFYRFLNAYLRLTSFLLQADAHLLARSSTEDTYSQPLSQKHMRILFNIVRVEKAPVFHILHKDYGVDALEMVRRLHKDFLVYRGAQSLLQLMDLAFHRFSHNLQDTYSMHTAQIFSLIGWSIFELPGAGTYIDRSEYNRGVLSFFEKYSSDLQDLSIPTDSSIARDLIVHYATLLNGLCLWDKKIATELVDRLLDLGEPDSPTSSSPVAMAARASDTNYRQDPASYPALVSNAWKFKILRKYIVKGNMGLRVMSIAAMDTSLVEIWREFNSVGPSCSHPVMQYLADFLSRGRVAEYIVGVDSHPQLISRSGNIVGFLVVTHRWTDEQADAIWKTVATSLDHRVVTATMTVFNSITNLMKPTDHLYLCSKLYALPIERYTIEILRFLRELTGKLIQSPESFDYDSRGETVRPWNVCIRLIRDTAPCRKADKSLIDMHNEVLDQFRYLTAMIPTDERHHIYKESAEQIADHTLDATGNFKVIGMLLQSPDPTDTSFLEEKQWLMRSVLEEIPAFVTKEAEGGLYPSLRTALHYRLDILRLSITREGISIPTDLHVTLWDHTIGHRALSDDARNVAWSLLSMAYREAPKNDFCRELVSSYIPTMSPSLYTTGLFEFVSKYRFPTTRQRPQSSNDDDDDDDDDDDVPLQIPGADILWPIVLSAPSGTIEDRAARLLASRYVQSVDGRDILPSEFADAQVALADKCMQELRNAIASHSGRSHTNSNAKSSDEESVRIQQLTELRVSRILLFQKMLLELVRLRPEFNRGGRVDSKVEAMDTDMPIGDAITVKYQCGNDRQSVTLGADHTMDDLYRRLCHATGYTKLNLFAKGQRLKAFEGSPIKLSEFDFGGQVIAQRADGAETTKPLPDPVNSTSRFELAILKHFEELFAWMDCDDVISSQLSAFLNFFPYRTTFADGVTRGDTSSRQLFPPGKVYQARYAANALLFRLREQIQQSTMSEVYLRNSIQRIDQALLNTALIHTSLSNPHELQLAAVLVSTLIEFLRERPGPEMSAEYFSDSAALVDRLFKMISVTLQGPDLSMASVAQNAYATILEASLHSIDIWKAFVGHVESHGVHSVLLLSQPIVSVREHVARKIASICGGDLPSTSPVKQTDTATHFWTVISKIISEAKRYPGQSKQLFELADHVFRAQDEHNRDEEYLRSLLAQWGSLLLQHDHHEFPGREEIDHFVLGLTKLLLCCILSIKSFKKPVNAGSLMVQVFKKYLFVNSDTSTSEAPGKVCLPILESHTRQELYDLMLGLAEDRRTYDTLLELAGEVENTSTEHVLDGNLVDRSLEIRSAAGYAGLFNPRAICYMNSLLTQLFMNINFREFILSVDVREARGAQRLLFETQRLFAQMQDSYRRCVDPRAFAACLKNIDKTPIDIAIQMDADEFYNLLFDQWEAQLVQRAHKVKFRSFYGGQTLNQIKSKECDHVSERAEPFFAVQCDVKDKANLLESLQAYVQGDVMEGDNKYKCESCGGKFVDAVKRTCLKDVPDNLILHLKRFEFDYNDMCRKKIYDHFAFPDTLDITPYTADYLSDPSKPSVPDSFDLVGVLVHTGTCENGHYYSYIRQRPTSSGSTTPTWIEFNDSEVSQFNPAEIGGRAFGGFADIDDFTRHPKHYSAYMLFYQRRVAVEQDQRQWVATSHDQPPKIAVPSFLEAETDAQNASWIREYSLYDPVHSRFVKYLHGTARTIHHGTCSEDHDQETRALQVVLAHLGHIAWRRYTADSSVELLGSLHRAMMSCAKCCTVILNWFAVNERALLDLVIKCTHFKVRSQVRTLVVEGLKYLRDEDPTTYGFELSDCETDTDFASPTSGMIYDMASRLRSVAEGSWESTRGWEDFYFMLTQIAEMGLTETTMLLNNGFLHFGLQLLTTHTEENAKLGFPELARQFEKKRGIYNRFIGFVWTLLSHTHIRLSTVNDLQSYDRQATFNREVMKFPLTKAERLDIMLWSHDITALVVVDRAVELFDDTKISQFYPGDIVKWYLDAPLPMTQTKICQTLIEGFGLDPPFCNTHLKAALTFCEFCPRGENIVKIISNAAEVFAKEANSNRAPSGKAMLYLFNGLLKTDNEVFFEQYNPHAFYHFLMLRSQTYALSLLCHYDSTVRKDSALFFADLYTAALSSLMAPETLAVKFSSARGLLAEVIHKFAAERNAGRSRTTLLPFSDSAHILANVLVEAADSSYAHENDAALLAMVQAEIEEGVWGDEEEEGSEVGGFEDSVYGSESEEGEGMIGDV